MTTEKPGRIRSLPGVAAWRRILEELQARAAPSKPRSIKVGTSIQEIAAQIRFRQTPRFFGLIPEQAALLAQFYPGIQEKTIEQAEKIKAHKFDVAGLSGLDFGKEIDWHSDVVKKFTWPLEHKDRLNLHSEKGNPRVPWEVSCFYHMVRLGQAYLYTQDESYAEEVVAQVRHWIKANPVGFGITWADPKIVGIRAVNWLWGYYSVLESKALNEDFLALWLASFREHGEYLNRHMGRRKPYNTRTIACLAGLSYLGIMFPEFAESARWTNQALPRLWALLEAQVYQDGVYQEGTFSDQLFLTEVALSVAGLCIVNGISIPEQAKARMAGLLDVIMAYTLPDGMVPLMGLMRPDRLHDLTVFSVLAGKDSDYRRLLGLGSLVLERQLSEWAGFVDPTLRGWSIAAGDEWQDAFWCFASDAAARCTDVITRVTARPEAVHEDSWVDARPGIRLRARALARKPVAFPDVVRSRGFESGGLYVMRDGPVHLAVEANPEPGSGRRFLGVTVFAHGHLFISDQEFHVDSSETKPGAQPTPLENTTSGNMPAGQHRAAAKTSVISKVTVHRWLSQAKYDFLDVSCVQNGEFGHRRQIWFDKGSHLWVIHDQLKGAELRNPDKPTEVAVSLRYQFAHAPVDVDKANEVLRSGSPSGPHLLIVPLGDFQLTPRLDTSSHNTVSVMQESETSVVYEGRVRLPADFVLMLYPSASAADLKTIKAAGRTALMNFKKALVSTQPLDQKIAKG